MTTLCRFPFAALRGLLFGLLLGLPALPAWADFEVDISNSALIRDTVTGLIWDRCALGWEWNGTDCGTSAVDTDTFDWEAALQAVVTANANQHLGYKDWRLPNIKELESLVDIDAFSPAIDLAFFHWPYSTTADRFWSSTTYASNSVNAWVIGFSSGYAENKSKGDSDSNYCVRLVRGGQSFDLLMPPPTPANVTSIPTLGEWATLLLAGLGMAAGWMALRRPRRS